MSYIIEGLDRLGKSTLIKNLNLPFIHLTKPDCKPEDYKEYQYNLYMSVFKHLTTDNVVYDRCHLSEYVYAPLYRNYSGDYVFEIENYFDLSSIQLILLTENFKISNHFQDDGLSFDITKRQEEQELFIDAFSKSQIPNKKIICVTADDGEFKSQLQILKEVNG